VARRDGGRGRDDRPRHRRPAGRGGAALALRVLVLAQPAADAGDPERAYALAAEGLEPYPDNPSLHYNLARFAAQAGRAEDARAHLETAAAGNPAVRERAERDPALASLRD
jgi:tetratricopeptide (TPR) repeat protein